ncbi:N-acetyllactosaminide beta-1,3-N-acetylglucosaminyltransferase 4-like [Megalops cyprinoides]|uniref:N-acetyllactosaminide beta-1,3-N-acetylglucosaminyltransferase 4-like n=1 Tax=Megalops cyprinoides TaxID=118141 RepID=UPI00186431C7|nr:N-acetyllactosaminide beta-1,3-N-acetylglucosaminyltransferase 4-like [Megalops cyprinoides]
MDTLRNAVQRTRRSFAGLAVVSALTLVLLYCTVLRLDAPPELHRAFLLSRHMQAYPVLRHPRSCLSPRPIALLLAIKSRTASWDRRAAVRATWGREGQWGGRAVRRVFLLGRSEGEGEGEGGRGLALDALVAEESERHGDVLQWDFRESFFNVTLKEVLFWRWFQEACSSAVLYVLKGDDDVFVDVEGVLGFLQRQPTPQQPLYVGRAFVDTYPVRLWWNKYYVPYSLYPSRAYPPYLGGGGYLVSRETIRLLLGASSVVPLFPIDDAYVGMCAQVANVSASHHPGFMPFEFSPALHPCAYQGLLVLHRLEPNELYLLWSFYRKQRHTCRGRVTEGDQTRGRTPGERGDREIGVTGWAG